MTDNCAHCIFWDEVFLSSGICWARDQYTAADTEACEHYQKEEE